MKSGFVLKLRKFSWFILAFIVFCFTLLNHILSGRLWLWNFFSIIPSFLFLVVPFILTIIYTVVLIKHKKKSLVLSFLMIIFTLFSGIQTSGVNINFVTDFPTDKESQEVLTIFNFNTEYWEFENQQSFYNLLKDQNAHVYHLQEYMDYSNGKEIKVPNPEVLRSLQKEFPNYEIIVSDELITMTRLPVIQVDHSEDGYLRTDIGLGTQIISFYNVHLPVHVDLRKLSTPILLIENTSKRFFIRKTIQEKLLADIQNNANTRIITGDFNTTPSMITMQPLLETHKDASKLSGFLFPTTWHTNGLKLWKIDYALTSNDLNILKYVEVDTSEFSDHSGILIEVSITTE